MDSLSITQSGLALGTTSSRTPTLITIIRSRSKLVIGLFLSMFAIAALIAIATPKSYEGSMEFLVSNERVNNPIGSEKNTQAILYLDDIGEARMNTEVSLLTSNDLLIEVVKKTRLASFIHAPRLSEQQREEMALNTLRTSLVVAPVKRSAIIRVTYKSHDHQTTVNVLQTLSNLYLDSHLKLRGNPSSYAFFQNLWQHTADERAAAETELANFKLEHKIISLPEEKTIALQNEADLERQAADTDAAANRSARQSATLSSLIANTPATIVGERKVIPNQTEMQQLSTLLTSLQNQRIELASRYLPDDRRLQDLDEQIAQTSKDLAAATQRNVEEVSTIANPVINTARSDSLRIQYEAAGLETQARDLRSKLRSNRLRLTELDQETAAYNLLSENVARLTDLDHEYRQKADAAQVTQLLDQDHISNVTQAEQPYASTRPAAPRVTMLLWLGFVWALLFAVVTVLVMDRLTPRVTSVFEVERHLGAPVLALVRTSDYPHASGGYLPNAAMSIYREPNRSIWRAA